MTKSIDQHALRYFIYARKSSESEEKQAYSIEDQLRIVWQIAQRDGLNVVGEYQEARTARHPGRLMFNEMLDRIEQGEADAILAWHPDRLARNAVDGGRITYLLDGKYIKHMSFANFSFTNDSQGKFNLYIAFAQSKYYTDNLSENVLRGNRMRVERGIYPGKGKRGYMNHPKTHEIIPDPDTFPLIKQMFELYAKGNVSVQELGEIMYALGLKSASGGVLSGSRVQTILKDPFYYGMFEFNGERHEGIHQPAITKELYDRAQAVMTNRGKPKKFRKKMKDFVFRGLLLCDECGHAITADEKKGHHYYHCVRRATPDRCRQPYIREEELADEFRDLLLQIDLPDSWIHALLAEIDRLEETQSSSSRVARELFDDELKMIQSRISRLVDLFVAGDLPRPDYLARKSALLDEKAAVLDRKAQAVAATPRMMIEPMREPLKLVLDLKNALAGGDLRELRDFVAKVGSNLKLNSRKVLWDWVSPYALLSQRASYTEWQPLLFTLRSHIEDTTRTSGESNLPLLTPLCSGK